MNLRHSCHQMFQASSGRLHRNVNSRTLSFKFLTLQLCRCTFHSPLGEANSYYLANNGKSGILPTLKRIDTSGLSMLGAFKLDHLQPLEPLLLWEILNFFTFILEGQFLLPQRANNGKREFFQPQNWMRQRVSSAWGIQTGPFAAH